MNITENSKNITGKRLKIIFVVPPVAADKLWGELSEEGSILPPLGISILAQVTRSLGVSTKIMDFLAEGESIDGAVGRIIREEPDFLGITATTDMFDSAVKLAREIKARNKNITILIGGPHVSMSGRQTLESFGCFDYAFVGESEDTLADFLNAYPEKDKFSRISGLVIRDGKGAFFTGAREAILEMDRIPFPAWDLLPDMKKYYRPAITNYMRNPVTSLVTSRGCAGQCIFCDSSVFGKRMRGFSADYVIRMIEYLIANYGIKEVCFYDDTFVAFKSRVFQICEKILEKKMDITWSCNARVNLVEPKMLSAMKRSGCWQVSYGIESGSQKILDILKKGITLEQIRNAVKFTQKAGISPRGYFMIANPGETKEDIQKTRRLMLDIGLDDILVEYFTPYPGTDAYANIKSFGSLKADSGGFNSFSISFLPQGLNESYLKKYFKLFYIKFYLRPRIIFNYLKRLGSPKKIFSLFAKFGKFIRYG